MITGLYRFLALFGMIMGSVSAARAESLSEYAKNCERHVGGSVPTFNCLDGEIVPITGDENGPCDNPQMLNGQCWNYSRLGKLTSGNPDVEIRFLCRHYTKSSGPSDPIFNDIAVIQHNSKTGATCFFQSPSGPDMRLDGSRVVAPVRGDTTIWQTPEVTASQSCVGCHDNRGFIKTPFLKGVTSHNAIPSPPKEIKNYFFPGQVTKNWRAYNVTAENDRSCVGCHNMATSNDTSVRGTSRDLGMRSAGLVPTSGLRAGAPMWMPFGASSAQAHKNCADNHFGAGCQVQMFDAPSWDDGLPSETGDSKLKWTNTAQTVVFVSAGQEIPRLEFKAAAGHEAVTYTHGHPDSECSWDYPRQESDVMVVTGRAPESGRYTLNGQSIVEGTNRCNIRVIATAGSQSISLDLTIYIEKASVTTPSTLAWVETPSSSVTFVDAGQWIPELVFRATSNRTITYSYGHPEDECSWDRSYQSGDIFKITGVTPSSGRFTMNGKELVESAYNICNVLAVADDGVNRITQNMKFYIWKG